MFRFLLSLLLLPASLLAEKIQYNRDVRPILNEKCFHCHGADASHRKGELRLDLREEAMKPAESGDIALVPGSPEKSQLLVRALLEQGHDDVMPPEKSGKPLTSSEKAILKQWIAEGAEYQGHWAFIAPVRLEPPKVTGVDHPVDRFIATRLEKEKLQMSPPADAATQMRRVALDLTGLPPSPSDLSDLSDWSDKRYEAYVDKLLASQHYGERMAMQWLDYARYADSNGFQTDSSRQMWPWRDWVIKAFNDNKPFDQFTTEQIAGDLIPNARRDQIVATGFNRNHRINGEGGIIAEEWRIENIMDRVETTSATWMGLTMGCCRCHDHKYDPISMKDFYSFFAFFNNVPESGTIQGASNRSGGNSLPITTVPTPEQEQKVAQLDADLKKVKAHVAELAKQLPQLIAAWEPKAQETLSKMKTVWAPLTPTTVESKNGTTLVKQPDGSYLATGANPQKDVYIYDAPLPEQGASAFLLECLTDPSLPGGGAGRYSNSNFALSAFDVYVRHKNGKQELLKLKKAEADFSQKGYEIANVIDDGKRKGKRGSWAVDGPTRKENRRAMFVLQESIAPEKDAMLLLRVRMEAIGGHNIGRFRLSASSLPPDAVRLSGDPFSPALKLAIETPAAKRTPQQKKDIAAFFRANVENPLKQADVALTRAQKAYDDFDRSLPNVMVMQEGPVRDTFVLKRGEYDKPGDKVTMATPAVLPPMPKGAPANRLGLAKWLVDPTNPLTARVWVNRTWEKFFGYGICKTAENLGSQAEYPVHPELLDWLATEFIRSGWDMKKMQKLIVMSAAYRQSSKVTPDLLEKDPDNRLLARGPRFRLGGEVVRDQALAIAGLLVPKVGGPSVKPYMPDGVWDDTSKYGDLRGYKADSGEGLYRRSFYTIWKRTAAPPTMLMFDAPSREVCTVKRSRTNTPLQALSLLNEVTFVEAAKALGEKMIKEGGSTPEQRIAWAFRRATARMPSAEEIGVLKKGLVERLSRFHSEPEAAKQFLALGTYTADASIPPAELAAHGVTASVILNLSEVVTRP
jgi:hypothetical protein